MKTISKRKMIVTSFLIFFLGMMMICSLQANNDSMTRLEMNDFSNNSDISANGWNTLVKLSTYQFASQPEVCVDSSNNIHVVWLDQNSIKYINLNQASGTWQGKVNSTDDIVFGGSYARVAADPQGNPYVSFRNTTNVMLTLWNSTSGSWETIIIDSGTMQTPDIEIDSVGNVHIIWRNSTNIYHRVYNSTLKTWGIISAVVASSGTYTGSVIQVDSIGNLHATYRSGTNPYNVNYQFWNKTTLTWNASVLISTDGVGQNDLPAITIGPEGNVYIAWLNRTSSPRDILFKVYNASTNTWGNMLVVASNVMSDHVLGLAADVNGIVHVAYHANVSANRTTEYRTWNKITGWSTSSIISSTNDGQRSEAALAVDSLGRIHIVWRDATPDAALHPLISTGYIVYRSFTISSSGTPIDPLTIILTLTFVIGPAGALVALGFLYPRLKK